MAAAIECQGVVKYFGEGEGRVYALRGVDLTVNEGELLLLVGPSGCGKTTLISIIAGILTPDEGRCTVLGENLATMCNGDKVDFRAAHIGFIFQNFNLLSSLTVAENVAIPMIIKGKDRREALKAAHDILTYVGLGKRGDSMPNQLSGGEQQRVAIARALVHQPSLVVCDEPTSALDHETGQRVMELMHTLNRERRTTFVVVTHDSRIFSYAHRIAYMDDGRVQRIETSRTGAPHD